VIVEIDYHPSGPQKLFHESTADEAGYGGDIGGGKTKALTMDPLLTALKYHGLPMYCFRATYQQGADTLLEEMLRSYPERLATYNKDDMTWYFNGTERRGVPAKLRLRQCKTLADAMKNDGKELGKLYIDEAQHLFFDAFDYLCTRVRANREYGVQPQVKFTAMQGGNGHAWIKRHFVDKLAPNEVVLTVVTDIKTGETFEIYRQFIPASLEDNRHLDAKYAGRLGMRSERLQKRTRTNDWNAIEGQAFPEWVDNPLDENGKPTDRKTHVVKEFEIPEHWPIFRGFDYGRAKPYSCLWFTKGDETYGNRLFLIRELYGGKDDEEGLNETASQIADKIAAIEKPYAERHGWITGVADPSIFSKSPYEQDESIASVMEDHGVIFESPHHNPDVAVNVINNRLQGKELIHNALLFDADGHPGFQVFDCCKKFRQHFPELVTDPKNPDDVDSSGNDHDYDSCRYVIVLTKPKIKAVPIARKKRRSDPLDFGEQIEDNGDTGKLIRLPEVIVGG
jgi:hypothetical protein